VEKVPVSVTAPDTAAVPLAVTVEAQDLVCLGPSLGKISVTFASTQANATGNLTVQLPVALDFSVPYASTSFSDSADFTMVLTAKQASAADVTLSATATLSGCTGAQGTAAAAPHTFKASLTPSGSGGVVNVPDDAPVPGLEFPLLAVAILGAVVLLRRRA
jgi:hypothetical protein